MLEERYERLDGGARPGFTRLKRIWRLTWTRGDGVSTILPIRKGGASAHVLGRFGKPEEVANAILCLDSEESSFVTGSPLLVDGGYLAR